MESAMESTTVVCSGVNACPVLLLAGGIRRVRDYSGLDKGAVARRMRDL